MNNKQIANTIWQQMREIDANLCMCMGVTKLKVIENGLEFKVSGLSFKGVVQVVLNGADLYDVYFIKSTRKQDPIAKQLGVKRFETSYSLIKELNDVYVGDLMYSLEMFVENRSRRS